MQGLRVLPLYQDARREDPDVLPGPCEECIAINNPQTRQRMGCGFLPEIDNPTVWKHSSDRWPEDVDTCPEYLVSLPEVADVARARLWFEKGCLETRLGPDMEPSVSLLDGIEILEIAINDYKDWKTEESTNPEKKTAQPVRPQPRQTPREPSRMRTPQEREAAMAKRRERK